MLGSVQRAKKKLDFSSRYMLMPMSMGMIYSVMFD